ncbi:hypothetical protein FSO04_41910 [Paraburkholderia madseniana]|uniref:Uncharacterized protein n=1 Tax=Paraburkholderia madseniana TaxID=2599607 RepID=A0A6N6W1P0_9BURK|nr:hypothetical protein FSO04_41910 [Paraburkholderia madseniana]
MRTGNFRRVQPRSEGARGWCVGKRQVRRSGRGHRDRQWRFARFTGDRQV